MSVFDGCGLFLWKVKTCCNSLPANRPAAWSFVVDQIHRMGLSNVVVKIADGIGKYNLTEVSPRQYVDDILPGLFSAFKANNITRLGFQYLYGEDPIAEADRSVQRIEQLGLQGLVLDPESQYCKAGSVPARTYMRRLRQQTNIPLALCTYRYPSLHRDFPWQAFLDEMDAGRGDTHMPQVYWEGDTRSTGPAEQLKRSMAELRALEDLPVIPVGAAYGRQMGLTWWGSTPGQMLNFADAAKSLGCKGINWWVWDELAQRDGNGVSLDGPRGWWRALKQIAAQWQKTSEPEKTEPTLTDTQRIERLESAAHAHGWEL